jgi:uncharacterized PurR-regulated membrane protein YhhQ (DUF165 family)
MHRAVALNVMKKCFKLLRAIFVVGMFMYFIIDIIKRIFEHRLKNKIVDKGISENIAQSILATQKPVIIDTSM